MPFHEIHGRYFNAVAEILQHAVQGKLTRREISDIVSEKAFGESLMTLPENLRSQAWPLLNHDFTTPLRHAPTMPLTNLQKSWMKALLKDPRIRLFDPPADGLEDVEPLFDPDTFVYFDRYADGDPYEDPGYIQRFRTILAALRENRRLHIEFNSQRGSLNTWNCTPYRLEYSPKDDKFRLITGSAGHRASINLARMRGCTLLEEFNPLLRQDPLPETRRLELELTDERNALERVMLHFSHLEKQTLHIGENRYRLILNYDPGDETEILIRVLSFGPMLQVIAPEGFRLLMRDRMLRQVGLLAQECNPLK